MKKQLKRIFLRLLPGWIALMLLIVFVLPTALAATLGATGRILDQLPYLTGVTVSERISVIAPFFTEEVRHWDEEINRWAQQYDLDPNLLATVMQIESCGDWTVSSPAGAQGLFQVMPFHFAAGENQIDPDTNAMRGANFLNVCLDYSEGDPALAMACYNGGQTIVSKPSSEWASETRRYYQWGSTIYADAGLSKDTSPALQSWLEAGGTYLCDLAAQSLGLSG